VYGVRGFAEESSLASGIEQLLRLSIGNVMIFWRGRVSAPLFWAPAVIRGPAIGPVHVSGRERGKMATNGYAHPEVLVETDWVAEHLNDAGLRCVEADEDILLYEQGHLPGAVKLDWLVDVQDPVQRDFVDKAGFEALMSRWGIANDTTVVFYGDRNNWYACYRYLLCTYERHETARIMNGGRARWAAEGRPLTRDVPSPAATSYT